MILWINTIGLNETIQGQGDTFSSVYVCACAHANMHAHTHTHKPFHFVFKHDSSNNHVTWRPTCIPAHIDHNSQITWMWGQTKYLELHDDLHVFLHTLTITHKLHMTVRANNKVSWVTLRPTCIPAHLLTIIHKLHVTVRTNNKVSRVFYIY
jgi:hypothetical protein